MEIFSVVKNFVKRHKKKLLLGGAVAAGYYAYQYAKPLIDEAKEIMKLKREFDSQNMRENSGMRNM
jgi:hypothetical protein